MQNDQIIWESIDGGHCSFRTKQLNQNFCRNRFNATGLCNRSSCPLANSRYATILTHKDTLILHTKVIERAHSPRNLWEKTELPQEEENAKTIINEKLKFWPEVMIERVMKRFDRLSEYVQRVKKLKSEQKKTILIGVKKKIERREKRREIKARIAARMTENIKKELLHRLSSNVYEEDIVNIPEREYENALDNISKETVDYVEDEMDDIEDLVYEEPERLHQRI